MKTIIISTAHSLNYKDSEDQKIDIKLEGGSPYFQYLWIDDIGYVLLKTPRGFVKLERIKIK